VTKHRRRPDEARKNHPELRKHSVPSWHWRWIAPWAIRILLGESLHSLGLDPQDQSKSVMTHHELIMSSLHINPRCVRGFGICKSLFMAMCAAEQNSAGTSRPYRLAQLGL